MADLRDMDQTAQPGGQGGAGIGPASESTGPDHGSAQNSAASQSSVQTTPKQAAPGKSIAFVGRGSSLLAIHLKNILLTVLTLGLYTFWARTNVRQFLWRKTLVYGEPLEYNGTGMELFRSFFWVATFFFFAGLALSLASLLNAQAMVGVLTAVVFIFFLLVPFAVFSALRYRLSRTSWRGTICHLEGNALDYAFQAWGRALLIVVTLGLYAPWAVKYLAEYVVSRCYFGNQAFAFRNRIGKLFGPFIFCWLLGAAGLILILVGLEPRDEIFIGAGAAILVFAWLYYNLAKLRWKINGLCLQGAQLNSRLTLISFLGLLLTNLLLVICTLGLGLPWAQVRWYRYLARRTQVVGEIDFSVITPVDYEVPGSGEGLLSWLNLDLGLGF